MSLTSESISLVITVYPGSEYPSNAKSGLSIIPTILNSYSFVFTNFSPSFW